MIKYRKCSFISIILIFIIISSNSSCAIFYSHIDYEKDINCFDIKKFFSLFQKNKTNIKTKAETFEKISAKFINNYYNDYSIINKNKFDNKKLTIGLLSAALGLIIGIIMWPMAVIVSIPLSFLLLVITLVIAVMAEITWSAGILEIAAILVVLATIPFNLSFLTAIVGIFFPIIFLLLGLF